MGGFFSVVDRFRRGFVILVFLVVMRCWILTGGITALKGVCQYFSPLKFFTFFTFFTYFHFSLLFENSVSHSTLTQQPQSKQRHNHNAITQGTSWRSDGSPSCLDGGVTRVGPSQHPRCTRAWYAREAAVGSAPTTSTTQDIPC